MTGPQEMNKHKGRMTVCHQTDTNVLYILIITDLSKENNTGNVGKL